MTTGTTVVARRARRVAGAGGLAVVLLLLAVGCSGASSQSTGGAAAPAKAGPTAAPAPGHGASAADAGAASGAEVRDATSSDAAAPAAARVATLPRDLVVTGSVAVRVKDVGAAATGTRQLAAQVGGLVASEQVYGTGAAPGDPASAQLTLRVPTDRAEDVMARLAGFGTLLKRELTTEDVTAQVVDVESRVATQRASVDRVRQLLAKAKTLGEVVQIESELTRRQADLESLEAQRKRLADLTDLATVTVNLEPPAAATRPAAHHDGFLAGLAAGWRAFTSAAGVGLTALGAVLPFLVLAALVGGPTLLLLRRRARQTPAAQPGGDGSPA